MAWSSRKKRGRPAKIAAQAWDYGNERVQARIALFRQFRGDSATGFEMSCAGRLMLVGAFDGLEQPAETYLSALLEYSNAYWSYYSGGPKVAQYEHRDRGHDNRWEDPRGEWFDAMDARLRDAGHEARKAVHLVSIERHWFPDEDCGFAARIIATRLLQKGIVQAFVQLADESDWRWLELLREGVVALAGQPMRRAA